jgi:arylsulfatase A-like enzyme
VLAAVQRWLDREARPPFFLFVHLWDPHYDYIPPPPYDTRFDPDYQGNFDFSDVPYNPGINPGMPEREKRHLVALYDGEIAATDAVVGALRDALARRRWLDHTLLVLTADHGEEFFDHGHKGHMRSLFEEMIHVPLLFRFPGHVPAGRRVDAVFASIHLMPTILGLVGLSAPTPGTALDLSGVIRGGSGPAGLWAFAELENGRERPLYAVRIGAKKYVGELSASAEVMAEDLDTDPGEQHPLPADDAERRTFAAWVTRAIGSPAPEAAKAAPAAPLDPTTRRELEALGYLGGP